MKRILNEHRNFWNQIKRLSVSELKKTYKGAALGPVWAFVKPVTTLFVFWFAFSIGIRTESEVRDVSFFLFLKTGMIPWFFMNDCLVTGSASIRKQAHFVTKMPFPMSTIMTYTLLSNLYVNIGLTVLAYIVVLCSGVAPSIYNIQLLYFIPLNYIFMLTLSWIISPLCAISKDALNLVKAAIPIFMWMSGILWDSYGINNETVQFIEKLNPINYIVYGYRNALLYETWFFEMGIETISFFAFILIFALFGSRVYNRLRKVIPDVL